MQNLQRAFTLIEILVAITIMLIFGAIIFASFWTLHSREALAGDISNITSLLSQARSKTISGENGSQFGVYFDQNEFTLFKGSSYSQNDPDNVVYEIKSSLEISNISLAGGVSSVVFKKISGTTENVGSVTVSKKDGSMSKTIFIPATGIVQ